MNEDALRRFLQVMLGPVKMYDSLQMHEHVLLHHMQPRVKMLVIWVTRTAWAVEGQHVRELQQLLGRHHRSPRGGGPEKWSQSGLMHALHTQAVQVQSHEHIALLELMLLG